MNAYIKQQGFDRFLIKNQCKEQCDINILGRTVGNTENILAYLKMQENKR